MIEVFRTDVLDHQKSRRLTERLRLHFPGTKINFDLDDCDKILRAEGKNFRAEEIIAVLNAEGHQCEILE